MKRAAAIARQEKRERLATEKAQKKMQKEEAQQQRLIDLQLSNKQKVVAKDQRKKLRNPQHQASSGGSDLEVVEERVVVVEQILTSKSGRQLRQPQRVPNYQL